MPQLIKQLNSPGIEAVPLIVAVPLPLSLKDNPRLENVPDSAVSMESWGAGPPVATTRNETGNPAVPLSVRGEMIASCVATLIEMVWVTGLPDPDAVSSS